MFYPRSASQYVFMPSMLGVFSLATSVGVVVGTELGVTAGTEFTTIASYVVPVILLANFCSRG